ncbi:MAG: hypothetical protein AB7E55_30155, partial [Pigmentiphaga sp.]
MPRTTHFFAPSLDAVRRDADNAICCRINGRRVWQLGSHTAHSRLAAIFVRNALARLSMGGPGGDTFGCAGVVWAGLPTSLGSAH